MKRNFYETPTPSAIMRFFWKAAGADRYILERVTYSDQIKYMCLGGIIFSTGLMAALAGGYAFYTIFEPKGSSLDIQLHIPTCLFSIVFGLFWGGMIFNLDRFIISSTGKGDGTEAITWDEFKTALPRLLMGAIIALTISKPVEIRMFKSEIDVELHNAQMQKQSEYLGRIDSIYAGRIENEKQKVLKWEKEINQRREEYSNLRALYNKEMAGQNGGDRGEGPQAKKIEIQLKKLDDEMKAIENRNQPLIIESYANLKKFEKDKQNEIQNSELVASGLDGLLERIKLAHQISGPWISLFITLLFMAIELTPMFFKLMLTKTPYDYLEENIKELMKAEEGILVEYNFYQDKNGQQKDAIIYVAKEKLSTEKKAILKAETELTDYAIDKYTEQLKQKIDANPDSYIQSNQ